MNSILWGPWHFSFKLYFASCDSMWAHLVIRTLLLWFHNYLILIFWMLCFCSGGLCSSLASGIFGPLLPSPTCWKCLSFPGHNPVWMCPSSRPDWEWDSHLHGQWHLEQHSSVQGWVTSIHTKKYSWELHVQNKMKHNILFYSFYNCNCNHTA